MDRIISMEKKIEYLIEAEEKEAKETGNKNLLVHGLN